jgi:hypothetical protein
MLVPKGRRATMMHLLIALLLQPTAGSIGENRTLLFDKSAGPTPVTDKDLRPQKLRDCRNDGEVQVTVQQIRNGEPELCFIRDMTALNKR